jgi:hypothetical protein
MSERVLRKRKATESAGAAPAAKKAKSLSCIARSPKAAHSHGQCFARAASKKPAAAKPKKESKAKASTKKEPKAKAAAKKESKPSQQVWQSMPLAAWLDCSAMAG